MSAADHFLILVASISVFHRALSFSVFALRVLAVGLQIVSQASLPVQLRAGEREQRPVLSAHNLAIRILGTADNKFAG